MLELFEYAELWNILACAHPEGVFTSLSGVTAELLLNGPDRVTSDIRAMFGYSAVGAVAVAILKQMK